MVLADPRLVESELVHRLDQFEVTLESERRILSSGMERRHEVSESHSDILDPAPRRVAGASQKAANGPARP
ncbi:hypothetical protein MGAD_21980 [Mycolicibacterium gadium]|uniref:Uncharacterized protein n=1 Tax=Mycolicibacterium gadium TaxID=1794 RepID=A0A7I7WMW7_MYCGU|nr:hypothetical protein MGAD_21980 [Mycolicibacterium gadium]